MTVFKFVTAVANGDADEIAVFGARGDGKTWGAATAMVAHAKAHYERGFDLPVKWLGATSTFQAHKDKTHDSLRAPGWKGCWTLHDGGRRAIFKLGGVPLVDLRLFGVGDEHGMDRLRAEAHCGWFEEAAPSEELGSRGMSDGDWGMMRSSLRMPSHANVALSTQNYPDDQHWTWERWGAHCPRTGVGVRHGPALIFRIPEGERATQEQREKWAAGITDPIIRQRLIEGRPGTIIPGRPVALGFRDEVHVSLTRLRPRRDGAIWLGQDGGLMPATVIAQRVGGRIEILASLSSQQAGIRQHFGRVVLPWLGEHAPWILEARAPELVHVCYDESMDTGSQADIETNALRVMQDLLPGIYRPGKNQPWSWRRDPLLAVLGALDDGRPLVMLDPEFCKPLIKAWRGLWHYAVTNVGEVRKEEPKKPNPPWADLGDASCYLLADMAPLAQPVKYPPQGPRIYKNVYGAMR